MFGYFSASQHRMPFYSVLSQATWPDSQENHHNFPSLCHVLRGEHRLATVVYRNGSTRLQDKLCCNVGRNRVVPALDDSSWIVLCFGEQETGQSTSRDFC